MYILDFLGGVPCVQSSDEDIGFEYRMLCSGELYNVRVSTFDWRKSDVTRILLDTPFSLVVCSYPFDEFPQELALQFSTPLVREVHGKCTSLFHRDDDIARDLGALLTLFCRRLITVAAKVGEHHAVTQENGHALHRNWPLGFVKSLSPIHWTAKPSVARYGTDGVSITDYNPPPLGVDPVRLKHLLVSLPKSCLGEAVVLGARLYALALQQFEHDTDIAYQLLIAAAECVASEALRDFTPTNADMISVKKSVADLAIKFGLSEEQASELAVEACRGIPWANRKFIKFIVDNTPEHFWKEDDLFRVPSDFLPDKNEFERVLGNIYASRGKLLHRGHSFPQSCVIGIGPMVPARALMSLDLSSKPFPPIVWFERAVNLAINTAFERSLPPEDVIQGPTSED